MLTRNDLDEAVRSGLITAAQAEGLLALPAKRHEARQAQTLRDERFVFMRSFNEFFIALGVVLLGVGLWTASRGDTQAAFAMAWAFPIIVWGLAEYLTAQKRYVLPSIVLAILFVVSVLLLADRFPETLPASGSEHRLSWLPSFMQADSFTGCAITLLAAIAFYVRFRLPFSLLMIVASAIPLVLMTTERLIGLPDEGSVTVALLILGLIVFAIALRFDMSDRERLTRRSDCAFWLMLAAAPLIVHPLVILLTKHDMTELASNAITLAIVALFALVALIVDRRAFLVSTLIYLGTTLISGIGAIAGEGNALWVTLVVIGGAVVLLGVGWQTARAVIIRQLPEAIASHFPTIKYT
jgi:hypothetical protein